MFNFEIIGRFFEEEGIDAEVISAFSALMIGYFVILGVVMLAIYLLEAFALFNMAKSAGFSKPWRSFIPFANTFLFGKTAEKYRRKDGKNSEKFGGLLLAFQILTAITLVVFAVFAVNCIVEILGYAYNAIENDTEMTLNMFTSLIPVVLSTLVIMIFSITYAVLYYIALWRIFTIFDNPNATLFLVLSIFFSVLAPIFLFVIRKNQPVFDPRERFNADFEIRNS